MRTVSECLHFGGKYYNSTKGKSVNQYISKGAAIRIESSSKKTYCEATILEHPNPLEKIYLNLLALPQVNEADVVKALGEYRLITVTSEENADLKHEGWKDPVERYYDARIEVGFVESICFGAKPDWKLLPLQSVLFTGRS
jgi:hypothetical protein